MTHPSVYSLKWVFSRVRRRTQPFGIRPRGTQTERSAWKLLRTLRRVQDAEAVAAVGPDQDQGVFPFGHGSQSIAEHPPHFARRDDRPARSRHRAAGQRCRPNCPAAPVRSQLHESSWELAVAHEGQGSCRLRPSPQCVLPCSFSPTSLPSLSRLPIASSVTGMVVSLPSRMTSSLMVVPGRFCPTST